MGHSSWSLTGSSPRLLCRSALLRGSSLSSATVESEMRASNAKRDGRAALPFCVARRNNSQLDPNTGVAGPLGHVCSFKSGVERSMSVPHSPLKHRRLPTDPGTAPLRKDARPLPACMVRARGCQHWCNAERHSAARRPGGAHLVIGWRAERQRIFPALARHRGTASCCQSGLSSGLSSDLGLPKNQQNHSEP